MRLYTYRYIVGTFTVFSASLSRMRTQVSGWLNLGEVMGLKFMAGLIGQVIVAFPTSLFACGLLAYPCIASYLVLETFSSKFKQMLGKG